MSNDLAARVAAAQALAAAATPGPWRVSDFDTVAPCVSSEHYPLLHVHGDADERPWVDDWEPADPRPMADAELIAAAPDLVALVAELWAEVEKERAEVARLRAQLPTTGPTWGEHCAGLADDLPICGEVVDSELRSDGVVDWVCHLPNGHAGPCWRVEERDNQPSVRDRILSAVATTPNPEPGTKADVLADAARNVRGTTTTDKED